MNIKRLQELRTLLTKYAHRWGEFPSARMARWQADYDAAKYSHPVVWGQYCIAVGSDPTHNAGDILA